MMEPGRKAARRPVVLDVRVVTGSGGGPDKTILKSPAYLARAGYDMLCAYLHPPGDDGFEQLRAKAAAWGAPLLAIPDRGPWDWRVLSELGHACRRHRVAVWHGHDYKSNALGLLLRRFWPMRLVTTVHGWVKHTRRTPLYYRIDEWCLPRYDRVICVSEDLRERCLARGVLPERCTLVENGVDVREYSRRGGTDARARLGVPPDRLLLGAIGRLSPEKGFDLLIQALEQLLRRGLDVGLVIAGEGGEWDGLQALVGRLGLGGRVRLLGYRPDPKEVYEAVDVFVLSSLREGLPNVVLEAMAMETPVVATRVAGTPRLIRDGENGLLVGPGRLEELTAALARVLGDAGLRARLARAGRETVETGYDFSARMHKVRVLYDALLRPKQSRPDLDIARLPVAF